MGYIAMPGFLSLAEEVPDATLGYVFKTSPRHVLFLLSYLARVKTRIWRLFKSLCFPQIRDVKARI